MSSPTLASTGQIYVTLEAGETMAAFDDIDIEMARQDLTELLVDATQKRDGKHEEWRYRSKADNIDITAHVVREGGLAIVTSCSIRTAPKSKKTSPSAVARKLRRQNDREQK